MLILLFEMPTCARSWRRNGPVSCSFLVVQDGGRRQKQDTRYVFNMLNKNTVYFFIITNMVSLINHHHVCSINLGS